MKNIEIELLYDVHHSPARKEVQAGSSFYAARYKFLVIC
jgi:hypothetical protein